MVVGDQGLGQRAVCARREAVGLGQLNDGVIAAKEAHTLSGLPKMGIAVRLVLEYNGG